MKMRLLPYLAMIAVSFTLTRCGNAEKKTDEKTVQVPDTATLVPVPDAPSPETPVKKDPPPKTGPGDVLSQIDRHLVTTPRFDIAPAGDGISNGVVTIHNKLDNSSFQKAIIEVSILLADGKEFRTDYYTVVNLEPGDQKVVKIPNTTRGVKVTSRVVKVKSNELTKGESVTVGNGYVPK